MSTPTVTMPDFEITGSADLGFAEDLIPGRVGVSRPSSGEERGVIVKKREIGRVQELMHPKVGVQERRALLGLLMAQLEHVDLDDVCALLKVKRPILIQYLHGDSSIPESKIEYWEKLSRMLRALHGVLKSEATSKWLHQPLTDLSNSTPLRYVVKGRLDDVLRVANSYLDPAFG